MPQFSLAVKDAMLDSIAVAFLSLHSAYSATGDNEISGGVPAYVRMPVTFAPSALGQKAMVGTVVFDIPSCTVAWIGMWDAGGAFLGMTPSAGQALKPFGNDDITSDILTCAAHGFILNDTLVVWAGSGGPLPAGLVEGTIYYVVNVPTVDTLELSTVIGGLPTSLTATGNGFLQRIIVSTFTAQATFPVRSLVLDANAAS